MATKKTPITFDSNPFTISFGAFSKFIKYAQSVFILALIFGFLGFVINIADSVIEISDIDNSSTQTTIEEDFSLSEVTDEESGIEIAAIIGIVIIVFVVFTIVGIAIMSAYKGFLSAANLAALKEQNIGIKDSWREMNKRFNTLFAAHLIAAARILGGYVLFVVPGIRAQLRYEALSVIIMNEKDISARQAIDRSKELYNGHLMEVFGIMTVGGIIPIVGQAIHHSGVSMSYLQIDAYTKANKEMPKAHILNYIGILFLIGIVVLIGILTLAITATI